jgi:hypothetical protein
MYCQHEIWIVEQDSGYTGNVSLKEHVSYLLGRKKVLFYGFSLINLNAVA